MDREHDYYEDIIYCCGWQVGRVCHNTSKTHHLFHMILENPNAKEDFRQWKLTDKRKEYKLSECPGLPECLHHNPRLLEWDMFEFGTAGVNDDGRSCFKCVPYFQAAGYIFENPYRDTVFERNSRHHTDSDDSDAYEE